MRQVRGGVEIKDRYKIPAITATVVIVMDQITKAAIMKGLAIGESIKVISGLFDVVHFRNPGAAFSIFHSGGALRTAFLIGTSVVALVVIGYLFRQATGALARFSLSLIAGGAIGNLIDRVRLGEVVDFLYLHAGRYYWPAFNVADSAITVGVALTFFSFYLHKGGRS